jgi:hypothetical protein
VLGEEMGEVSEVLKEDELERELVKLKSSVQEMV